ncbi:MAG: phage terminase small subunit P27 family [Planctomycetes bacterium]|nr:phage terminase small subunit P27 family [Planctomycetota bacterium]
MGRRGPSPTPTPILKLRGSTLVTKKREKAEVRGPAGLPECPDWLDSEGQAAWEQIVPLLSAMGILTRIDANALGRYCRLWTRWKKAEEFITKNGDVYPLKAEDGKIKCLMQFPQVSIAMKLAQQLTRLEQEFGMTPSARSRIQLQNGTAETNSDKSRFFEVG